MIEEQIKFGTSGHRGILAKTFTTEHTRAIAEAVVTYLQENEETPTIVVGYDSRTGNSAELEEGSYTKTVVDTLLGHGADVWFFDSYSPTPLISWVIDAYQLSGGLILTASHNPPNYNGIKFNPQDGAPAPTEVTTEIQNSANNFLSTPKERKNKKGTLSLINKTHEFAESMFKKQSQYFNKEDLDLSNISIIIDAKHGTVQNVWDALAKTFCINDMTIINQEPLTDFGQLDPNPANPESLRLLAEEQKKHVTGIAAANDPDGDRQIILDENGNYITPEEISVIILDYFIKKNLPLLGIASTVASSALIKKACEKNNLEYCETAVGFKYFARFLKQARKNQKIALAVESSGGFSTSFHTLEKCGFLPIILILNIMKKTGKKLYKLRKDIIEKYGQYTFKEVAIEFAETQKKDIIHIIQELKIKDLDSTYSKPIEKITKKDGVKIVFKNQDWVLVRLSGTEPVARIYAESTNPKTPIKLINNIRNFFRI